MFLAPGNRLYSTFPNNEYEYSPGHVPMAAPAVSGEQPWVCHNNPSTYSSTGKKYSVANLVFQIKTKWILGGDNAKCFIKTNFNFWKKSVNAYNALYWQASISGRFNYIFYKIHMKI